MRDHQQRARIASQPVLQPHHGVEIQVISRLIEQQQVTATHQRLRKVEAHAPPPENVATARDCMSCSKPNLASSSAARAGAA
jgi:hypothetical protein